MFPPIPPPDCLVDPCNGMPNNSSDLSGVLPVPDDEIAELEWLPTFVEDSLSTGGITLDKNFSNNNKKDDSCRFRTSNPVSVLKNSSSCSGGKTMPLSPGTVVPGRLRVKRPRSAIFFERPAQDLASLKSCKINGKNQPMPNSYISSESEYFTETHPPYTPNFSGGEQKKKKKKRQPPSMPSNSSDHDNLLQQQQQPGVTYKKCSHCEVAKTSLWRSGPMGRELFATLVVCITIQADLP